MSNRTIIEINHDVWFTLRRDPAGFSETLVEYLRSGDERAAQKLNRYGVRVLATIHHTTDVTISFGHTP